MGYGQIRLDKIFIPYQIEEIKMKLFPVDKKTLLLYNSCYFPLL